MKATLVNWALGGITLMTGLACAQGTNLSEVRLAGAATEALIRLDYASAIVLADRATDLDPTDPWPHYDRASALVGMRRTEEAVSAFKEAENLFGDNWWGRSIAIYGRARAYQEATRCADASKVFEEYASFVRRRDPGGASLATRYAHECPARSPPAVGGGPTSP